MTGASRKPAKAEAMCAGLRELAAAIEAMLDAIRVAYQASAADDLTARDHDFTGPIAEVSGRVSTIGHPDEWDLENNDWSDPRELCRRLTELVGCYKPATVPAGQTDAGPGTAAPACGRCGELAGHGAKFCDACIDRCHEATDFAHVCQICATPQEAARYGWSQR